MPPQHRLKPSERAEIIGAHKNGVPLNEISANTGIPRTTVKRTWRMRDTRDENHHDLDRSGRSRKSTIDENNRLYRRTRIDNNLRWAELIDISSLSRSTIRRKFIEIDPGYRQYMRHWSLFLTPEHMKQRRQYEQLYRIKPSAF